MIKDIDLDLVMDNPFNARLIYSDHQIELLARSIEKYDLLSPVKVRAEKEGKYLLVFGHRRVRAMRLLKRKSISADVCELSNEDMLQLSYAENMARADLSDYEKALYFERTNREFGMTYDEIGAVYNLTKSQISNYVRMSRLFDQETLSRDPSITSYLTRITERHARALSRVYETSKRLALLKSTVEDDLSVRDLERMIVGFKGWLDADGTEEPGHLQSGGEKGKYSEQKRFKKNAQEENNFGKRRKDVLELKNALESEFRLPMQGDYQSFLDIFARDGEYGLFSMYAGGSLRIGTDALRIEEDWFYSIGRYVTSRIRDFRAQFFGNTALATCRLEVEFSSDPKVSEGSYGGTIVFVNRQRRWRILHEHWSKLTPDIRFADSSPGKTEQIPADMSAIFT